ncbi:hypothetical protein K491DRAFT_693281 [Lophiostoma macrostomum CBS 122681]|uniref:CENP-V/GFA domain-containing protein n=1 Tax=Lophiostoma macrostomum CBS 122681 TaxID=1314788 RepID=A0A6A6T4K5_9PLEO|nr:hypothetical protein K491DRAFT_693281 [Lophiostoma macrostomum CBS 122681]
MAQQSGNSYTGDPKTHPDEEFKDGMTGTCLCGAVKVTIHDPNLFTNPSPNPNPDSDPNPNSDPTSDPAPARRGHLCHCANCRKISGSFVSANLLLPEEDATVSDPGGSVRVYEDFATGSGKPVRRAFCGGCGCPILSRPEMLPGKIILKMGIFPRIPAPEMECFAAHKHVWEPEVQDIVGFKTVRGGERV